MQMLLICLFEQTCNKKMILFLCFGFVEIVSFEETIKRSKSSKSHSLNDPPCILKLELRTRLRISDLDA